MFPSPASGVASFVSPAAAALRAVSQRSVIMVSLLIGGIGVAKGAAVDWRLLGDWEGNGPHAGFVITFAADGGYVIAQEGVPAGFGSYAVDGRQILLFPGGAGEFPERGAYGFSGPDRLFVMTQNFGRSEWQRRSPFAANDSSRNFEYEAESADDKSSFEKAVEKLEQLSESLEGMERKLDGESTDRGEAAASEPAGKKRSLFDRMKDAARKTAGSAGNLTRKAARSVKAAGDAWKGDDRDETETATTTGAEGNAATPADSIGVPAAPNPMLGGAVTPAPGAIPLSGLAGGISSASPAPAVPAFGAGATPLVVDVALAHRAAQVASQWKADARLVEIAAQLGADGSANVAATPQAVALMFVSAGNPDEGLKLTLTSDGSFVTATAPRLANPGRWAPATFIPSRIAVNSARQAGLQGEAFSASLRAVPGGDGASRFGWFIAPAGNAPGSGEIVIDAVTGQPLR